MNSTSTAEQRELRASARRFARTVLSEVAPAIRGLSSPEERFLATRPMYEKAIREGFLRKLIPVPFGGDGQGLMDMAILAEEFYAVDASVPLTLFANALGLMPLFIAGTPEQREKYLAPFLSRSGAPLAALANSEPGGSANFDAPYPGEGTRTRAVRDAEGWSIRGAKQWISSATGWDGKGADLLCVTCRTDADADAAHSLSLLIVGRPASGIVVDGFIDPIGHRGHLLPRFRFEDVRVPLENVVGPVGGARDIVNASFSGTAALVGVFAVGVMRAAFDYALNFARVEHRGGAVPIIEHQAVGYALADAKMAIETARALSWSACQAYDLKSEGAFELALHSKVFCSETAINVITNLMKVVGIESYDSAVPLSRLLQDALAFPLFDGGNMGVRRRQLHQLISSPSYDPFCAADIR